MIDPYTLTLICLCGAGFLFLIAALTVDYFWGSDSLGDFCFLAAAALFAVTIVMVIGGLAL